MRKRISSKQGHTRTWDARGAVRWRNPASACGFLHHMHRRHHGVAARHGSTRRRALVAPGSRMSTYLAPELQAGATLKSSNGSSTLGKSMNMKPIEMLPGRPSRTTGQHVDHDRPRRGPPTSCSCCAALLSRDSFLQILSASSSMSAFAAAAAQTQTSMAADGLLLLRYSLKASATHGSSITKVEGCQLSRSVSINFVAWCRALRCCTRCEVK